MDSQYFEGRGLFNITLDSKAVINDENSLEIAGKFNDKYGDGIIYGSSTPWDIDFRLNYKGLIGDIDGKTNYLFFEASDVIYDHIKDFLNQFRKKGQGVVIDVVSDLIKKTDQLMVGRFSQDNGPMHPFFIYPNPKIENRLDIFKEYLKEA